jgi:DNA transformation protein
MGISLDQLHGTSGRTIEDDGEYSTRARLLIAAQPARLDGVAAHKDQDFLAFVIDQLSGIRRVTSRRMFGGIGLYSGDEFFGLIDDGKLYFFTDVATRKRYEARGIGPFEYAPGKVLKSYYEIPVDVLEDDVALCDWAREAIEAHRSKPTARRKSARKREA